MRNKFTISADALKRISDIRSKIEDTTVMDISNRYVAFSKNGRKRNPQKSAYLATKDGIRWALDAAGNTGQYIKYVNMKIDKHQSQINNLKAIHKRFDKEIAMLQTQKLEKIKLDKDTIANLDVDEITKILDQLSLGKRITKSKLRKLENECGLAEKELEQQEIQIDEFKENLKEKYSIEKNGVDPTDKIKALEIIKDELNHLSKDKDINKLSNAIDLLISHFEKNN